MTKNNTLDQVAHKLGHEGMENRDKNHSSSTILKPWLIAAILSLYILLPWPLQHVFLLDYTWKWPFLGEVKLWQQADRGIWTWNPKQKEELQEKKLRQKNLKWQDRKRKNDLLPIIFKKEKQQCVIQSPDT